MFYNLKKGKKRSSKSLNKSNKTYYFTFLGLERWQNHRWNRLLCYGQPPFS